MDVPPRSNSRCCLCCRNRPPALGPAWMAQALAGRVHGPADGHTISTARSQRTRAGGDRLRRDQRMASARRRTRSQHRRHHRATPGARHLTHCNRTSLALPLRDSPAGLADVRPLPRPAAAHHANTMRACSSGHSGERQHGHCIASQSRHSRQSVTPRCFRRKHPFWEHSPRFCPELSAITSHI